ncbi:hypothetical protein KIK06_23280 [Nocardiopsis sp. EMB25]|uniref:hypothetical protein n=1 Tax=Nocardiopsis sp. EMB25 TaxID=2835867 RepID=UPI002284F87A|nr:hypothetical protein [Nocardiopsis sp. EMB25]MCY9786809.1 hypothetical protein [Nocardiopsis sp. EMB25]
MPNVSRRAQQPPTVPLDDVLALLAAVQDVLDLPKDGASDAVVYRLAHTSGVLSAAVDQRGITTATDIIRRTAASAQAVPGE